MAIYIPVIVEENIIGDSPVLIQEDSANDGMALLLNSLAETKYILTSIMIWSINADQIRNPIIVSKSEADGNIRTKVFTPEIDSYQFQNKVSVDTQGFELDQFAKVNYKVEPNTVLRMTFDVATFDELSLTKTLDKLTGEFGILEDVKDQMGFNEMGEVSDFYVKPIDQTFEEPDEKIEDIVKTKIEKSHKGNESSEKKQPSKLIFDSDLVVLLAIAAPILLLLGGDDANKILKL